MDPTSFDYLCGSVVDFDDGLGGKGFEIRNPKRLVPVVAGVRLTNWYL